MTNWHVDDELLGRWVGHTQTLQQAAAIEQHLLGCEDCRDRVRVASREAQVAPGVDLDLVWTRLRDAVEVPRPSLVERGLRRVGLSAPDARLVATAEAFRGPWLTGVLLVMAFVILAAEYGRSSGQTIFLAVAPVLPSLAVAFCYDPSIEPALEQELVAPYSRLRLVMLRTLGVLGLGLPVVAVISPVAPGGEPFLWLLPAAGFVAAVLALSTWTDPLRAVAAISGIWLVVVMTTALSGSADAVLYAPYRVGYLAVAVVSVGVFAARARHLSELRPRRSWL
jgi:hypothetical protein